MKVDWHLTQTPFPGAGSRFSGADIDFNQAMEQLRAEAARRSSYRNLAWFWSIVLVALCAGVGFLELLGPPSGGERTLRSAASPGVDPAGGAALSAAARPGDDPRLAQELARAGAPAALDPAGKPAAPAIVPAERPSDASPAPDDPDAAARAIARGDGAVTAAAASPLAAASAPSADAGANTGALGDALAPAMISIPGGAFRMGSNEDRSERPIHTVVLKPFAISKYAVSVLEWEICVAMKGCTLAAKGRPEQPMANVSWDDARQFAEWLSRVTGQAYRLPTEAEWEYAARAGGDTRFSWGNTVQPSKVSCRGCGTPVDPQQPPAMDAHPPNAFGLYGMGGGVAEWVGDCWHRDYADAPRDGSTPWDAPDCRERVLRGGSWMGEPDSLRVSSREYYDAAVRYPTHGFRLVKP